MKYVRVMDGATSNAGGFEYKIDAINETDNWHPNADTPKEMGGFNFCQEDKLLRWLHRGDTLYDVIIPKGAEVIEINHKNCPSGLFRCNKIMVTNPRKVTEKMVFDLYHKSTLPEKTYYQCFCTLLFRGYKNVVHEMVKDLVNKENAEGALTELKSFIEMDENGDIHRFQYPAFQKDVREVLNQIEKIQLGV